MKAVLCYFCLSFTLLTFTVAAPCFPAPVPIMRLDEIHPGMTGSGRTVFNGDSIEEFEVRILGTLRNFMPKKDLILAELLGDRLRHTGVIAGMSGSPVYVEGRLIGAVAYGWSFSKEPIAGITPIDQMLDIPLDTTGSVLGDASPSSAPARAGSASALYDPFQAPDDPLLSGGEDLLNLQNAAGEGNSRLERLAVPLVFSGCDHAVIERFAPAFRRLGLIPVMGGGAEERPGDDSDEPVLEAGAAVAAQLVRGDLSLAATGTMTWRKGDKVLAFGHPFLQFGPVDFPMTTARIVTVLPNLQSSFKLSNSSRAVGAIRTDHTNGVLGLLGGSPDLLPFDIVIRESGNPDEKFHFEMVRHKRLTPTLSSLVMLNSLTSRGDVASERAYRYKAGIRIEGLPDVEIEDMAVGAAAPIQAITSVQSALLYLYTNQFGPADIRSIDLSLELSPGNPRAQVSEVFLDRTNLRPGDTLGVDVVLEPFGGTSFRERFSFPLPDIGENARLFVLVGSGEMITRTEFQLSPNRFRYTSIEHLVRLLNASRRSDRVYVKIFRQDRGILVNGRELEDLPISVWSVLRSGNTSGSITPLADVTVAEQDRPTDFVVSGLKLLQVTYNTNR